MPSDMSQLGTLAANYGLGVALSVFIAGFLAWILRFVLKENAKREDRLATIIENHLHALTESVNRLSQAIAERDRQMQEACRYQREEHREMVRLLEKLNGREQ